MKKILAVLCLLPTSVLAATDNCRTMETVPEGELTLQQVIELGLCRNPETASAYLSLESARFKAFYKYLSGFRPCHTFLQDR